MILQVETILSQLIHASSFTTRRILCSYGLEKVCTFAILFQVIERSCEVEHILNATRLLVVHLVEYLVLIHYMVLLR